MEYSGDGRGSGLTVTVPPEVHEPPPLEEGDDEVLEEAPPEEELDEEDELLDPPEEEPPELDDDELLEEGVQGELFRSTETLLLFLFATARSTFPSPFKSLAAIE